MYFWQNGTMRIYSRVQHSIFLKGVVSSVAIKQFQLHCNFLSSVDCCINLSGVQRCKVYICWFCYYCLQSQEEAYESNKEDDAEGLVGPWEGWPLFLIYGKHKYSVLLLCRHPQDTRKHLWHVCATGQGFLYYLDRAILTLLLID